VTRLRAVDRHVVLIGLPGAGKTSTGRHLAKLLHRPFADADEQLELTAGCTIARLVRERGEDELHRCEDRMLGDLVRREHPLVISAPGAVAISRENRTLLAGSAVVVWLTGSTGFLTELGDPTHRPRLADDQHAALTRLDGELSALYDDVADHVVDVEPFHASPASPTHGEPRRAIAGRIVDLLGLPTAPPPARSPARGEILPVLARLERQLSALYDDVADHVVDVEPFHAPGTADLAGEEPRHTIARHILDLVAGGRLPDET
jgi:shikimate kinase